MDWPSDLYDPVQYGILSTMGEGCLAAEACSFSGNGGNTGFGFVANTAIFTAVIVPQPVTVYKMAWINGGTVGANVDVGIYDWLGNRLVSSGSTVQATINVMQVVDVADTVIPAGVVWIAAVASSATGQFFRGFITTQLARISGMAQMASAFPLPTTATFAAYTGSSSIPVIVADIQGAAF